MIKSIDLLEQGSLVVLKPGYGQPKKNDRRTLVVAYVSFDYALLSDGTKISVPNGDLSGISICDGKERTLYVVTSSVITMRNNAGVLYENELEHISPTIAIKYHRRLIFRQTYDPKFFVTIYADEPQLSDSLPVKVQSSIHGDLVLNVGDSLIYRNQIICTYRYEYGLQDSAHIHVYRII